MQPGTGSEPPEGFSAGLIDPHSRDKPLQPRLHMAREIAGWPECRRSIFDLPINAEKYDFYGGIYD